jgi:hypothetical protein
MPHQSREIPLMVEGDRMLVWDPGTGKTYPVTQAAELAGLPHLTICPAHLRDQWADNVARHKPWLTVRVLDATKQKADLAGADFVICSFEYACVLPRWRELRRHPWASIAVDEAHALRYETSNRTAALLGHSPESTAGLLFAAKRVWFLTGTPFTFPNEIFPILSRMFPDATRRLGQSGYMTAREWENRYCITRPTVDKRTGRSFGEKVVGAANIPELRRRLDPIMSKVRIGDVHDQPEVVDHIPIRGDLRGLLKGLEPEALEQYEILTALLANDEVPEDEKLAALETSGLVMAQLRHHVAIAKVGAVAEIARWEVENAVDKVLVFGWHREPLRLLADKLKAPLIYGTMPKRRKADALASFIDGPSQFLVGQIGAIGTGTDGLQDVCRRILFSEASWAYHQNKQARHRTFRKGQRGVAHTSFISLKGSVDEYVTRVLANNAETVARVLD